MREHIWYELMDIKSGEIYLALYINRCRRYRTFFKITTLVFSTGGVFGWKYWEPLVAIAFGGIAAIQILSLIENHVVRSDDEILRLGELRNMYVKYFCKLEKLFVRYHNNAIKEDKAEQLFFKLGERWKNRIEALDNEIYVNPNLSRLLAKTEKQLLNYSIRYGKE